MNIEQEYRRRLQQDDDVLLVTERPTLEDRVRRVVESVQDRQPTDEMEA